MSFVQDSDQFIPSSPSDELEHTPYRLPVRSNNTPTLQNPTHEEVLNLKKKKKFWRICGGLTCILTAVMTWVFMAEFLQKIQEKYHKVFFIRFSVNTAYVIMIVPHLLLRCFRERKEKQLRNFMESRPLARPSQSEVKPLWRRLIIPGVLAGQLSVVAGWLWYVSLDHTEAAVNSTIYQSQVVFAFIFAIIILGDKVKVRKIVAVFVALGGVAMISFAKPKQSKGTKATETTITGILLTILSASMFGLYEVLTKYYGKKHFVGDHKVEDTLMFQVMVGITGFFTTWPYFLLLDHFGFEKFEWPHGRDQWMAIGITAGTDTVYTGVFLTGITLIGPVPVALGQLLVIPSTFLADYAMGKISGVTPMSVIGCALVIIGFVVMEVKCKTKGQPRHSTTPYYSHLEDNLSVSFSDSDSD